MHPRGVPTFKKIEKYKCEVLVDGAFISDNINLWGGGWHFVTLFKKPYVKPDKGGWMGTKFLHICMTSI